MVKHFIFWISRKMLDFFSIFFFAVFWSQIAIKNVFSCIALIFASIRSIEKKTVRPKNRSIFRAPKMPWWGVGNSVPNLDFPEIWSFWVAFFVVVLLVANLHFVRPRPPKVGKKRTKTIYLVKNARNAQKKMGWKKILIFPQNSQIPSQNRWKCWKFGPNFIF